MENNKEPYLNKVTYPVLEYSDMIVIGFQDDSYEFQKMSPEGNIIFKKHEIKSPDLYGKIKEKIAKFNHTYGNLAYDKDSMGINLISFINTLKIRWFQPKHIQAKEFIANYEENIACYKNVALDYEANEYYSTCILNKIYMMNTGEIYIQVTYKNKGISLFGTYNEKSEIFNLRDIDNIAWLNSVLNMIDITNEYLEYIKYDDTYSA